MCTTSYKKAFIEANTNSIASSYSTIIDEYYEKQSQSIKMKIINKCNLPTEQKDAIHNLIKLCANTFFPKNSVIITIKTASSSWMQKKMGGVTAIMQQNRKDNNKYTITLNEECSIDKMLLDIIHEMIHVEQYVTKKLQIKNKITYWEGKPYKQSDSSFNPWEKDVFSREWGYFVNYLREHITIQELTMLKGLDFKKIPKPILDYVPYQQIKMSRELQLIKINSKEK